MRGAAAEAGFWALSLTSPVAQQVSGKVVFCGTVVPSRGGRVQRRHAAEGAQVESSGVNLEVGPLSQEHGFPAALLGTSDKRPKSLLGEIGPSSPLDRERNRF